MTKDKMETLIRALGAVPVSRDNISGYEVFFGDGFSEWPHINFVKQGALSPGQFPKGCYVTWWFAVKGEDHLKGGAPVFFDPDHDVAKWHDESTLQQARINVTKVAAKRYLDKHG